MAECLFPNCPRHAQSNGFCIGHKGYGAADVKEKQKPIAKASEKRKVTDKEYKKIVKEMLGANNKCEINEVGCTGIAQGLHHLAKRLPSNLTDRSNLMRACNNCNLWIENNSLQAAEKGLTISRFKPKAIVTHDKELNVVIVEPV